MGVALGVAPAGSEELGTAAAGPFEGGGGWCRRGNGIKIIFPFYYLLLMKMQIKLDFPCRTKTPAK